MHGRKLLVSPVLIALAIYLAISVADARNEVPG